MSKSPKKLLLKSATKTAPKKRLTPGLNNSSLVSYPWEKNSCWLDTSLEIIYRTVSRDFQSFSNIFTDTPEDSFSRSLFHAMDCRHDLAACVGAQLNASELLQVSCNSLRQGPHERRVICAVYEWESLFVCLQSTLLYNPF